MTTRRTLNDSRWVAYFNFEREFLEAPEGPLSQETCEEIWHNLPQTGCAWIERGHLFVQQRDGAIAWDCGEVAEGVTAVRSSGFAMKDYASLAEGDER